MATVPPRKDEGRLPAATHVGAEPTSIRLSSEMLETLHAHRPRRTNADCDCPTCAWRDRLALSTRN